MTDGGDDSTDVDSPGGGRDEADAPSESTADAFFEFARERLQRGQSLYDRYLGDRNRLAVALLAIVFAGLVLRLVVLGARVAHYDEGRVAYWSLHHARTDSFAYRFIIHGPLVQHLHRWLFPIAGASDFTMRLPVALVGSALPGTVWLFRKHLRDSELLGAALLLALNPLLLYYSRFMRSDLLVATFMFVALGLAVRFYDTRKPRYLYGVVAFIVLGFSSKENAIVYLLTWVGAAALLTDHALFRPRSGDSGFALLAGKVRAIRDRGLGESFRVLLRYAGHWVGATILGFVLLLFMYAPRGDVSEIIPTAVPGTASYVGFWEGITNPAKWGQLVDTTLNGFSVEMTARSYPHTFDGIIGGLEYWFTTEGPQCSSQSVAGIDVTGILGALGIQVESISGYPCTLGQFLDVLVTVALPFIALAVVGTILERYGRPISRNLVMFTAYIGFVSLIGYPLGTDIFGAWILVHVLVPLSIPAGVMLAKVYRWGTEAFADEDAVSLAISTLLIVLLVGQMVFVSAGAVYTNNTSGDNVMVQYAQASNDLREPLEEMNRIARDHDGEPDMIIYGSTLTDFRPAVLDNQPHCAAWYNPMLPLPWYLYKADVTTDCVNGTANLTERLEQNPPPIVLTTGGDNTVPVSRLDASYEPMSGEIRTGARERVFWIHEDWLSTE